MKHFPTTHGSKMSVKSGLCGTSVVRVQNDIMTSSKHRSTHARLVVIVVVVLVIAAEAAAAMIVVEVIVYRGKQHKHRRVEASRIKIAQLMIT